MATQKQAIDAFLEEYRAKNIHLVRKAPLSLSREQLKPLSLWAKAHLMLFGGKK